MRRERVCGLENEYALSLILEDGSSAHDGGDYRPYVGEWFWRECMKAFEENRSNALSPFAKFGFVRDAADDKLTFWVAETGGKFYEDLISYAPLAEYATPECCGFEQTLRAEKAGERMLHLVARFLCERRVQYHDTSVRAILFSKNNSGAIGGKSFEDVSFRGSHENYDVSFDFVSSLDIDPDTQCGNSFETRLASFLPVRMLFAGAGGLAHVQDEWRYFLSPRGSVTEAIRGAPAHDRRPMFCWVQERETEADRARLEVVCGDSNAHPAALRWRLGLTCALLRLLENGRVRSIRLPILEDPIAAMRAFSSDPTLRVRAPLGGKRGAWTIVECAREWLDVLSRYANRAALTDAERSVMRDASALANASAGDPDAFSEATDWGLKRSLLEEYCRVKHLSFSDWKARRFDVHYSDISPDGIFNKWQACEARKNPSRFSVPFSEEDMNELVWRHRAAPRAELRKRHLRACFAAECDARHDWGRFYSFSRHYWYGISDPMEATHRLVEEDLQNFQRAA